MYMVGAEGFEASVPSDHYAVLFVEFNSNTLLRQGIARILSPMDDIPQEFGITGIHPVSRGAHRHELMRQAQFCLSCLM